MVYLTQGQNYEILKHSLLEATVDTFYQVSQNESKNIQKKIEGDEKF